MAEIQIQPQTPPKTVRIPSRRPQPHSSNPKIHDLVCIGFGTLGLGLAVALQDTDYSQSNTLFLEQNASFTPETNASVDGISPSLSSSFAHDLATLRNPTSKYTYLNYLCETNNLASVVGEAGSPFPSRTVFAQYLYWTAMQLSNLVRYGKTVTDVRPIRIGEMGTGLQLWAVTVRDIESGRVEVIAARNVVFAHGQHATFAQARELKERESLQNAVDTAREICTKNETEVTIEEKLDGLALESAGILRSCFESDSGFNRKALL